MENHVNSKRLSSSDLLGSTENLLKDEHSSSSSSSSSSNSNKNYKNASGGGGGGGSSSPRGHGTANGSVPSSSGPSSSSSSKGDRKQKCGGGKNATSHRDPVENCIPNNQLSKPEALVRLDRRCLIQCGLLQRILIIINSAANSNAFSLALPALWSDQDRPVSKPVLLRAGEASHCTAQTSSLISFRFRFVCSMMFLKCNSRAG